MVTVRALGGFELFVDGRRATPTAPKPRQILAVLALRRSENVSVDALVDELWGERPPRGAVAALQTHVYELRKELRRADVGPILTTGCNGYALDLPPRHLDVTRFDDHIAAGAAALGRGDAVIARRHLLGALRLSTPHPLTNVRCGGFLSGQVVRLQEARLRATELKVDAEMHLGRHDAVIGDLQVAVTNHPFHEGFVLSLMTALQRRGRRGEALAAYRALRDRLLVELDVEPEEELQHLYRTLIHGDGRAVDVRHRVVQLPPDLDNFTGRESVLADAAAHLLRRSPGRAHPVVAITGPAGVGKTATAVHLAHAVRDHFPDGQLFLDLRREPQLTPACLAARLMHGLGLDLNGPDSLSALRAWSTERRLLIVLDGVSPGRIKALPFAGQDCGVVVTSHSAGIPPGAHVVTIPPMDHDEGIALLDRLVPGNRVRVEPTAAKGIVELASGLPLALRDLAAWVAGAPTQRLDGLLATLTDAFETLPLSQISALGPDVHDCLHAAYHRLEAAEQHAFRMLAMLRADDFTTDEASRAFLLESTSTEMALLRLAGAHFVRPLGDGRWVMPSLLRRLALECLTEVSSGSGRACRGLRRGRRGSWLVPWSVR